MADTPWMQSFFGKGELSPLMYGRVDLKAYFQALKTAKNIINYPQGAAGKRFGTTFLNNITTDTGISDYTQIFFEEFQYLGECVYQLVFTSTNIFIYLEGYLIATVTSTPITADMMPLIDTTVIDNVFEVTTGLLAPMQLTRAAASPNSITDYSGTTNTLTVSALALNGFWPARFTTTTSLPTTFPQIQANKTYFVRAITTTTIRVYRTAQDAASNSNFFTVSSAGTSASVVILNTWTFANTVFSNVPTFDFGGNNYNAVTFTPGATSGTNQTLTASGGTPFNAGYVGGLFIGNGGIGRLTAYNSTTVMHMNILQAFNSGAGILGILALLTEPAWSATRGWPNVCSSFENRAFFGNTDQLPNGIWASVTNEYTDFDDSENNDDSAISWYPTSDAVNVVNFIVPYRSLTVHTNSGVYSTPLGDQVAITPTNFSLKPQDSTPADVVRPRAIDNQIIAIAGNDVYSLVWDGFNTAYTTTIASIVNEHLINKPIDEAAYIDKDRAGSRYMFIINSDGTMAIYQTLLAEDIAGFTPAVLEQSYGKAYFRYVSSSFDGRAWFITERQLASAGSTTALGFIGSESGTPVFIATGHGMVVGVITAVIFTLTDPVITFPQINATQFYWAIALDANTFNLYLTQTDAEASVNQILASSIPITDSVTPWPLTTNLLLEQLDFDAKVDCAGFYNGSPASTFSGQTNFTAQDIVMQGDGYGFIDSVVDGNVDFDAHGSSVSVSVAQWGFPINVEITPLPLALSAGGSPASANLVDPKHVRYLSVMVSDTIGGTISQGNSTFPLALTTLNKTIPGNPPQPMTGYMKLASFGAWDDFNIPLLTINHSDPFDFKLIGLFYMVDI